RFFCELAGDAGNAILGVVASGRPEHDGFGDYLDKIASPKLAGIRRVLHTQPDELSRSALFRENVARLGARGLTFDLCVLQRQLGLAAELARACPSTTFILDHCGVPDIAGNDAPRGEGFRQWVSAIRDFAALSNVNGKISGLTAYAAAHQRNAAHLRPYIDTMLEAFGPSRLVWGGDWPVVNLGSGLPAWCDITRELLAGLPEADRSAILLENAARIYKLRDAADRL
ncbi:MAG: amidohydrolase, partial [Chthoniobacterales bacterium]|nr:amidohydrolase [Chthoniobacterales bacterium]